MDSTYALRNEGSGNVASAIAANQYSIGYLDAGHGHTLGFEEISLTNAHGQKLTSNEADISKAASTVALPSIDGNWEAVNLTNLPGEDIWPITAFSYIYAKKDKATYGDEEVAKLVKSFVLFVLSDEGQSMVTEFGFYPLDSATKDILTTNLTSMLTATIWTIEGDSTDTTNGMNEQIFSKKRKSYGDYERELLVDKVASLETSVVNLQSTEMIPVHGSGTTNPSKFFWKIMDVREERSRIQLSLTYRAVGSGTGIKEFVGESNNYNPYSHFGSGDIPVPTAEYSALQGAGKEFITIPFQLGAISFFHNVPGTSGRLDLKPCVLAKIFTKKITTWDHPEILDVNPGFNPPAAKEIVVVRRIYGSSSTSLISQFLFKACPNEWTIGVGKGGADLSNKNVPAKAPFWPTTTVAAEGSGGVSDTIVNTPYSIGYLDSGHGHALKLAEVTLQNKEGTYLTSRDASISGAVTQIMTSIPNADGDWANENLSLLDLPGAQTWPITAFSYIFLRKDLTSFGRSGPAIKAFVEMVLSEEGQKWLPDFGFAAVPSEIKAKCIAGLSQLKFSAESTMFTHEKSTAAGTGMGAYVLSVKRKRWSDVEREILLSDFNKLRQDFDDALAELRKSDADSITKHDLHNLAVPGLVIAVTAFTLIASSLILGSCACVKTSRHERFFNDDEHIGRRTGISA